MIFTAFVTLVLATAAQATRKCGAVEPSNAKIQADTILLQSSPSLASFGEAGLVVPTYFHVLRSGNAVNQGNVPDSQLYDQVCYGFLPLGEHPVDENSLMYSTRTTPRRASRSSSWESPGPPMRPGTTTKPSRL